MKDSQGNPEIGMSADSLDAAEAAGQVSQQPSESPGSEAFFENLEHQVNGGIVDTEVTQNRESGPKQVTHTNTDTGSNNVAEQSINGTDWEKRYTDSSREAVKWRDKYKEVEKFVPVLDAMKKDSGLVEHVRGYLVNGGQPAKSIQEKLGLDEDFMFDQHEAMTDPESDSAKLMNAHVDSLVQQRVGQMVQGEQQRAVQLQRANAMKTEETAFKEKHNMTDEQFEAFKSDAKQHTMTLDDVNYNLNRDKAASNVAQNTKQDMLNQMKNVRNMPTSASGANNQGQPASQDREVFENILGFDNSVDNLFG